MTDSQLSLFNDIEWPIFNSLTTHFPNDEYSELEYKSAQGGFPKDFWRTYSAFANTNGGFIILVGKLPQKTKRLKIEFVNEEV